MDLRAEDVDDLLDALAAGRPVPGSPPVVPLLAAVAAGLGPVDPSPAAVAALGDRLAAGAPRPLVRRVAAAGIATVVVLGGTAAATSGSLPAPVQRVVHDVAAVVGADLPDPDEAGGDEGRGTARVAPAAPGRGVEGGDGRATGGGGGGADGVGGGPDPVSPVAGGDPGALGTDRTGEPGDGVPGEDGPPSEHPAPTTPTGSGEGDGGQGEHGTGDGQGGDGQGGDGEGDVEGEDPAPRTTPTTAARPTTTSTVPARLGGDQDQQGQQ